TPSYFRSEEERMEAARLLEELAGIPAAETFNLLSTYADLKFVRLAPAISLEAGRRILEEQAILAEESGVHPLLNVTLTPTPQRYYPERAVGAQVVGSLAILGDAAWTQGVSGIEDYYDQYLRKRDGVGLTGRSFSKLSELPADVRRFLPSVAGKDLILTLDRNVQWIAEEELQWALTQFRAQSGTIIVMDPRTGEILAMANSPTFDPNDLSKADMAAVQNTAISAQYEPGSVFKMITAAAALDSGVVTPTQTLTDTGSIAVGQRVILNSDRVAHGVVDMTEALARSLNVITAQWALMLGQKQFYQYLERFGFGQVTEVDLADEVYGLIKRPGTLDWSLSDLGTNSFGQGLAVTPIQMANAIASIANGGKLMRPYIVKARVLDGQVQ
ncbi:MAG: penicillin-binding protein 2, partial [Caldilineaceae bacterium]|nr:penicillin-binding protein 2 [Caldilineaceae bacterium]